MKHIKVEELVVWGDDSQEFSEGELEVISSAHYFVPEGQILVKFVHNSRSINVGKVSSLDKQCLDTLTIPNHRHTLFKYTHDELPKTIVWSFITT